MGDQSSSLPEPGVFLILLVHRAKYMEAQGIARLEGEMQAVRTLLGNSSTIVAALMGICYTVPVHQVFLCAFQL